MPNGQWYKNKNYSNGSSQQVEDTDAISETHESFEESKSWSGVWVEDLSHSSSSIFQDIQIFIEGEKYSRVYCDAGSESDECIENDSSSSIWAKGWNPQEMINQISSSKGKWLDAEEICKVGNKRKKDMQQDEIENLRMFCYKSKNSLLEKTD